MELIFQIALVILLGGALLVFLLLNFREIASLFRIASAIIVLGVVFYGSFSNDPNLPVVIQVFSSGFLMFIGAMFLFILIGIPVALFWDRSVKFQNLTEEYARLPLIIRFCIRAIVVFSALFGFIEVWLYFMCGQWGGGC